MKRSSWLWRGLGLLSAAGLLTCNGYALGQSSTTSAIAAPAAASVRRDFYSPVSLVREIHEMERQGWKLTFDDEFSGKRLDTRKWSDSYPGGVRTHSNNEQQYYSPHGYDLKGGDLRLIARNQPDHGMRYASGMIASYGHFAQRYGWFEIRAKFPHGRGYWPAFWLLPENRTWPPEIDILEILGHEPDKVYLTNHYLQDGRHGSKGASWVGPDFSAGYHTFALDWEPASITWYVDGVQRFQVTDHIPTQPMYVIANLAVGGDWPGMPDASTPFPGIMSIDYIRVYQHRTAGPSA